MKRTAAVLMIFGLLSVGAFADTNDNNEAQTVYNWADTGAGIGEAVLGSAGYVAGAFVGAVLAPTPTAGPEAEIIHSGTASGDDSGSEQ